MRTQHFVGGALLGALAFFPSFASTQPVDPTWEVKFSTNRHNDVGPVSEITRGSSADYRIRGGRNIAYMEDEARLTRSSGRWSFSLLVRSSGVVTANGDALAAANQFGGTQRSSQREQWNADARMTSFTGAGAEVKLRMDTRLPVSVSAQVLGLSNLRELSVQGPAGFDPATGTYSFDLHGDKADRRLTFPFMRTFPRYGLGVLFGAETSWEQGPATLHVAIRDLGWLIWNDLPHQVEQLSTQTRSVDQYGYVIYKPLLQGRNTQARFVTHAIPRLSASADWHVSTQTDVQASVDEVPGFGLLPAVSASRRFGATQVGVGWRFHERRLELALRSGGFTLALGADSLGSDAHSRFLMVSYRRSF